MRCARPAPRLRAGRQPLYDPSGSLRDYLVRCMPGSDELLLGKAYFALGPLAGGRELLRAGAAPAHARRNSLSVVGAR